MVDGPPPIPITILSALEKKITYLWLDDKRLTSADYITDGYVIGIPVNDTDPHHNVIIQGNLPEHYGRFWLLLRNLKSGDIVHL